MIVHNRKDETLWSTNEITTIARSWIDEQIA